MLWYTNCLELHLTYRWLILSPTQFFNAAYATSTLITVRLGGGRHLVTVKHPVSFAKSEIATEVLYNPAMITVKFSILLLYHRIFPSVKFKMLLWAVAAFTTCYTIASILVLIFQCVPVRADWDPTLQRRCVNLGAGVISSGVLNSVTDFAILGLPMPYIWRLHSSFAQKVQLMGVFSLRGLSVAIPSFVPLP